MFVPNRKEIDKASKQFRALWHPDKWTTSGFSDPVTAALAHMRGIEAYDALERWYARPYCPDNQRNFEFQRRPEFRYADGLPSFANPCRCTYSIYIFKRIKQVFIPYFWQPKVPQTESALSSFCPCTAAHARASWLAFDTSALPPLLERIVKTLPYISMDYRIILYKIRGRNAPDYFSAGETKVASCVIGELPACKDLVGWVVEGDFLATKRPCLSDGAMAVVAEFDKRMEDGGWDREKKRNVPTDDDVEMSNQFNPHL